MKREIRQRCRFGCVRCGIPLYEYDHLDEYAVVKRHVAERITLLCDRHHRERTNGLLPTPEVEDANRVPYNAAQGQTSPYELHFGGPTFDVNIGGNLARWTRPVPDRQYTILSLAGAPIIMFKVSDSHLLLSMNVVDAEARQVLRINDNELVYTTTSWDVEFVGTTLTVRDAPRSVMLSLDFQPPGRLDILSGKLPSRAGVYTVSPAGIWDPNRNMLSGCSATDCGAAFAL